MLEIFKGDVMKAVFMMVALFSLSSLSACNVKDATKSIGDLGNSAGDTIENTADKAESE